VAAGGQEARLRNGVVHQPGAVFLECREKFKLSVRSAYN
jgi:hypothetical protein